MDFPMDFSDIRRKELSGLGFSDLALENMTESELEALAKVPSVRQAVIAKKKQQQALPKKKQPMSKKRALNIPDSRNCRRAYDPAFNNNEQWGAQEPDNAPHHFVAHPNSPKTDWAGWSQMDPNEPYDGGDEAHNKDGLGNAIAPKHQDGHNEGACLEPLPLFSPITAMDSQASTLVGSPIMTPPVTLETPVWAGYEAPPSRQNVDATTSFLPSTTFVFGNGSGNFEFSFANWSTGQNNDYSWKVLGSVKGTDVGHEDLPGADAKLLQHPSLVPDGLFCATKTTKQVAMSTGTDSDDKSLGGPLSDSQQQFTHDFRFEIEKIRDPSHTDPLSDSKGQFTHDLRSEIQKIRDRIHGGPFPVSRDQNGTDGSQRKAVLGRKALLASMPPPASTGKVSSSGVKKSPSKKPGPRVRQFSTKAVQQLVDMTYTGPFAQAPETGVEFGLAHAAHPFPVSLPAQIQSQLYADFDRLIRTAANGLLIHQYHQNRLDDCSIKKAKSDWFDKHYYFPKEFLFDQATQRALIETNSHKMYFPDQFEEHRLRIKVVMDQWKGIIVHMNARKIRVPDCVIRKIVYQVENVLTLLNANVQIMCDYHKLAKWVLQKLAPTPEFFRRLHALEWRNGPGTVAPIVPTPLPVC